MTARIERFGRFSGDNMVMSTRRQRQSHTEQQVLGKEKRDSNGERELMTIHSARVDRNTEEL